MIIRVPLRIFKEAEKPRRIASRLGISRDKVYNLRRELKRKAKSNETQTLRMTDQQEIRKAAAIEFIKDFIREHAHRFYTASDVRRCLLDSEVIDKIPSLTTIRNWMKTHLKLAFKKVNLRFKAKWSTADLIVKLKYLWIFRSLKDRGCNIVYIDEFNISSTSIKTYNWSVRGCQDYWFADKKSNKLNCIIAVSADGPVDIFIQEDSIKAENFSSFVEGIVQKLRSSENDADSEIVLVYDNASIHISKLVQKTIDRIRWAVVTLPPYTPEWNDSEVVINIIKRKLDSDIKQNK